MDAIGKSEEEFNKDRHRIFREYQLIRDKKHDNLVKVLNSTDTKFTIANLEHIKNLGCLNDNDEAIDLIETQCNRLKRGRAISMSEQRET